MELQIRERVALIDDEDWPRLEALLNAGHRLMDMDCEPSLPGEYVYIAIFEGNRYKTLLGRWLMDAPRHLVVGYENWNTLDMRKANLRLRTLNEVQWHRRTRRDVQDQGRRFKGIEFNKEYGKWSAKIRINGKRIRRGGWFDAPEDAAKVYDAMARELFGDRARLNFPDSTP